jgi:hypothetical protein
VNVGQYIAILQAFGGIDLNADGRFLHAANLDALHIEKNRSVPPPLM